MSNTTVQLTRVKRRISQIQDNIKKVEKEIVLVAGEVRENIMRDSRHGIGLDGETFDSYSKLYEKRKLKEAYEPYRSIKPNLSFSGRMLSEGMSVKKITNGAKVYFNNKEDEIKAIKNHYGIGVKARPFFGISEKSMKYIKTQLQKIWRLT